MFLLRISRVGASRYYATARLRCLNRNILINNAFVRKLIQILGVNEYSKSCYIQNESRNICRLWSNFSFPLNNVNILIFHCLWSALYPMNILCKNAFKRERPRCVGPRYLLINKNHTALYKMIKNVTNVIPLICRNGNGFHRV